MSDDAANPEGIACAADGWTQRFTAFGHRLSEAVELYRQLGYEIRLEPARADPEPQREGTGCASCFVMTHARTIYTRPRTAHRSQER
jgi:hypothetical protein